MKIFIVRSACEQHTFLRSCRSQAAVSWKNHFESSENLKINWSALKKRSSSRKMKTSHKLTTNFLCWYFFLLFWCPHSRLIMMKQLKELLIADKKGGEGSEFEENVKFSRSSEVYTINMNGIARARVCKHQQQLVDHSTKTEIETTVNEYGKCLTRLLTIISGYDVTCDSSVGKIQHNFIHQAELRWR